MGTLTYSHTLVAGTNENVNDVQDMFNDAKAVINGNITGVNAPAVVANYTTISYSDTGSLGAGAAAGTYYTITGGTLQVSGSGQARGIFVNSALWAITGVTTKLRIDAMVSVNNTAPAVTFTFGLYPYTVSGAVLTTTLGTVVAGSTFAIASPGINTTTTATGSDFSLPANGPYVLGVATSGSTAASSSSAIVMRLSYTNN